MTQAIAMSFWQKLFAKIFSLDTFASGSVLTFEFRDRQVKACWRDALYLIEFQRFTYFSQKSSEMSAEESSNIEKCQSWLGLKISGVTFESLNILST